jgi:hypothetical protein
MYWLYRCKCETDDDIHFYGDYSRVPDGYKLDFSCGIVSVDPETTPPIELFIPNELPGNMLDNVYVYPGNGILISKKLQQVFDDSLCNIQWYKTTIQRRPSQLVSDEYCLGNIIGKIINAVDFPASDLVLKKNGKIRFIDRLVLREDIDPPSPIFRINEFESLIFVTDQLKRQIEKSGCTGIEFQKPEDLRL